MLTGEPAFGPAERELLSLPGRLRELSAFVPIFPFSSLLSSSSHVASPLIDRILRQCTSCSLDIYQQMFQCKYELRASCHSDLSAQASFLYDCFSPHLQCAFDTASD